MCVIYITLLMEGKGGATVTCYVYGPNRCALPPNTVPNLLRPRRRFIEALQPQSDGLLDLITSVSPHQSAPTRTGQAISVRVQCQCELATLSSHYNEKDKMIF
jgi:hypothetical protein